MTCLFQASTLVCDCIPAAIKYSSEGKASNPTVDVVPAPETIGKTPSVRSRPPQLHLAALAKDSEAEPRPAPPSVLSRRLLLWIWKLVWKGYWQPLQPRDIPQLKVSARALDQAARAQKLWQEQLCGGKPRLGRMFLSMNCLTLSCGLLSSLFHGVLAAGVRPLLLRHVISSLESHELELWEVLLLSLEFALEAIFQLWSKQFLCDDVCVSVMSVCTSLLSKRIPVTSDGDGADSTHAGEKLVSEPALVGSHIVKTMENSLMLMQLPSSVVQLMCAIVVLLYIVGLPALAGIACATITVVLSRRLSKVNKTNDWWASHEADKRVALLRQILDGIHFIKLNAWEPSYIEESSRIRMLETGHQRRFRTIEMLSATVGRVAPVLATMSTFLAMILMGLPMKAEDMFATLSIFLTLRLPLGVIPQSQQLIVSMQNSLTRITRVLQKPEVPQQPQPDSAELAAALIRVDLQWPSASAPVVSDATVEIFAGRLHGVIGGVGSGKSTLLAALLGGLTPVKGTAFRRQTRTAYVPQKPIVFSGPILANVLMGHPMDESRLWEALGAAQFLRDLELLPHGLDTEIGERGTTLSGGQQTRLNIARAFYHDPMLLVADDPLAAVDVHVASSIFEAFKRWQKGGVSEVDSAKQRGLLLTTNQLHLLHSFDHVVYLEGGRIRVQGSPSDIEAAGEHDDHLGKLLSSSRLAVTCDSLTATTETQEASDLSPVEGKKQTSAEISTPKTSDGGKLIKAEKRNAGAFQRSVPLSYLRAAGPHWISAYLIVLFMAYLLYAANDWWLTIWIRTSSGGSGSITGALIYAALGCSHALAMVLTNVVSGFAGAHASRNLHRQCLEVIMRAPLHWFQETPSGRTISRMSADINIVDLRLPSMIDHSCQMLLILLVSALSVCVVMPWMALFVVIITPVFVFLDIVINKSSREAKRMTNNGLSPIMTLLQEAIGARLLLRVMGQECWLHDQLLSYTDEYNGAYFVSATMLSALRFFGSAVGALVTLSTSVLLWGFPEVLENSAAGLAGAGLALTYSFVFPYFLAFLSLFASMVRIFLASLERLLELKSDDMPREAQWDVQMDPGGTDWPGCGRIEFRDATLRYRPQLPPAVNRLTLEISAGERLGIVGRTGAGKSSISVLLLRLVELETGSVLLDGVDVGKIGLHTLRRAVAMVPQDPFLFQGTISKNLDPFGAHSKEALVAALGQVGMHASLDDDVGNGGSQLSAGERQLVAIARATLSCTKVVVMDEPTASCDAKTDAHLQEVVRVAFAGRTVLCIAHRLNTILSYDRVLVMEAGSAVELGAPQALVSNPSSRFAQMVARMHSSKQA